MSLSMVLMMALGVVFIAAGVLMGKGKLKRKSMDQRLAETFQDYDKLMDNFRK